MSNDNAVTTEHINHSELGKSLGGDMWSNYMKALNLLAENPGLTNHGVSIAIGRPLGSMGTPCRAARDTLGIIDTRGAGGVQIGDFIRYAAVCAALGVTPAAGTSFAKVSQGVAIASKPPARIAPVDNGVEADGDAMAAVRTTVANLRKQMKSLDIERILITRNGAEITRNIRTTSVVRI